MARRWLPWIVALASASQVVGMARSPMPAQDGLKFLRVARQFHSQPWADVIRGSDQHPLYPACVALVQPVVSLVMGPGPDSWRLAAQAVSALATLALIVPLFGLARALFDEPTAILAALLFVLLPRPAELGHDTLSDALALCAFVIALRFGEMALRRPGLAPALGCGIAAGLGYWARPEVAVVPVVVVAVGLLSGFGSGPLSLWERVRVRVPAGALKPLTPALSQGERVGGSPSFATLAVSFLVLVGSYALVKGEVSEKLALRRGTAITSRHDAHKVAHSLPKGLADRRWSFAPKEESGHPARMGLGEAARRLGAGWVEGLAWLFAPLAILGAWRVKAGPGRWLIAAYFIVFSLLLVRHATTLGYLSDRHVLTLVVASLPWAAAGTLSVARRLATRLGWTEAEARRRAAVAMVALIFTGVALQQARPSHPSRWGHREAGRWIASHAKAGDAVLDTRGWAAFVSGRPSYDYWHVRQALTDGHLAFVVVGADELSARSRRAETLRAVLAHAAEPAAAFPERHGGSGADVLVYRFHRPDSWEGLGR
jgi:hypothetical protein